MITISDAAAKKINEIVAGTDRSEKQMLRISYGGFG
jgi:Fe-S cluster assembly iron-binding protein IscA